MPITFGANVKPRPISPKLGTSSSTVTFSRMWFWLGLGSVSLACIYFENAENGFLSAGGCAFPFISWKLPETPYARKKDAPRMPRNPSTDATTALGDMSKWQLTFNRNAVLNTGRPHSTVVSEHESPAPPIPMADVAGPLLQMSSGHKQVGAPG